MKKCAQGFTLIEILLAISMFSLIVAFVAGLSVFLLRNYSFSFEEQQVVGQAQQTITQIVREVRKAHIGDDGSWPIATAGDTEFSFYTDINADGSAEKIRYFLNGTDLVRGVISPTDPPTTYIQSNETTVVVAQHIKTPLTPLFQYYNGNWPQDQVNNPLSLGNRLLNTRYIKINIFIDPTQNFAAEPFEISTGVSLRNLKDNL